jgi:PPOX class probable F420-dependent enzyme
MLQAKMAKFSGLRGEARLALTTFDAEGTPIMTTQRFAKDGDRLFILVTADTAQRIHENAQVEVAPCTEHGETLGESIEAMAVVLPPDKAAPAKHALADKYGLAPRLRALRMALRFTPGSYVEITPM